MNETAILARASAVGLTAPGKCPLCLRLLNWDRFETGLGLACSDPTCPFERWFANAELEMVDSDSGSVSGDDPAVAR